MGNATAGRNRFVRSRGRRTAANTLASSAAALRNRVPALCGWTMENVMIVSEVTLRGERCRQQHTCDKSEEMDAPLNGHKNYSYRNSAIILRHTRR